MLSIALFSDVQGTPSRRIRVGQRGQAHEQVRRIRRRSRTHLAESDALGGPMKERLWRWPIPMVIDRTRMGTIDRADAAGPCRGRATG